MSQRFLSKASSEFYVTLQDISQKLQPHQRAVAEAKARQSEPAAERDMLSQKHAAALKAFQVSLMHCPSVTALLGQHVSIPAAEIWRAEKPDMIVRVSKHASADIASMVAQHAGCRGGRCRGS